MNKLNYTFTTITKDYNYISSNFTKLLNCDIIPYDNLTDLKGLLVGNRDRHIGFSGSNSNVYLSGIALQELNRYILENTYTFETKEGQIINFALDKLRKEQ